MRFLIRELRRLAWATYAALYAFDAALDGGEPEDLDATRARAA